MKKFLLLFVAAIVAVVSSGCGASTNTDTASNEASTASSGTSKEASANYIPIEDIEWSVDTAIVDGTRQVCFEYTNNSKYAIGDVEITFKQKAGITTEELSVFNDMRTEYDWDDDEFNNVYIVGYARTLTEPGETTTGYCTVNNTYISVENMEQYEIMEPDLAEIAYIGADDKIYVSYYDFASQKYSEASNSGVDAVQWSDGDLAKLVIKPDAKIIVVGLDYDDYFTFTAYGLSSDYYDSYVESCKTAGFTEDEYEGTAMYMASNADGYDITVSYSPSEESIYVSVDAP